MLNHMLERFSQIQRGKFTFFFRFSMAHNTSDHLYIVNASKIDLKVISAVDNIRKYSSVSLRFGIITASGRT